MIWIARHWHGRIEQRSSAPQSIAMESIGWNVVVSTGEHETATWGADGTGWKVRHCNETRGTGVAGLHSTEEQCGASERPDRTAWHWKIVQRKRWIE